MICVTLVEETLSVATIRCDDLAIVTCDKKMHNNSLWLSTLGFWLPVVQICGQMTLLHNDTKYHKRCSDAGRLPPPKKKLLYLYIGDNV